MIFRYVLIILSMIIQSCSKEKTAQEKVTVCDSEVIISASDYENAPADELKINSIEIDNDCLIINFSSSGCNGDSWEVLLIDSDIILESFPPQRHLRLSLKNEELCAAYITKQNTFAIADLRVSGNSIMLHLTNSEQSLLYEY